MFGGGIATYYGALASALVEAGSTVDVLLSNPYGTPDQAENANQDDVTLTSVSDEERRRVAERLSTYAAFPDVRDSLAAAWAAYEKMKPSSYDVVEATDWGLLFVPWVVEEEAPPTLVQLHASQGQIAEREATRRGSVEEHVLRFIETEGLRLASGLQTPSEANASEWRRRLGRSVQSSPPPLSPPSTPDAPGHNRGFVAGRVQYWKGPTVLCEAVQQIQRRGKSSVPRIDWAGRDVYWEAEQMDTSEYLSRHYPDTWGNAIRPLGECTPEEVARRQAASSFVVVPSLWDVFNYTAVEAMGRRAVVVCSAGAGAAELIDDGESGFVVPPGDAGALVSTLEQVASLPEDRRTEIGAAAENAVEETLDPRAVAEARLSAYSDVLSEPRSGHVDWLDKAIRPAHSKESPDFSMLDNISLRDLYRYVLRRSYEKIVK